MPPGVYTSTYSPLGGMSASFSQAQQAYAPQSLGDYFSQVGLSQTGQLPGGRLQRPAIPGQVLDQSVNLNRANLLEGAQNQALGARDNLSGRGFGSNSPLGISLEQGIMSSARAAANAGETNQRMQAAQMNNQSQLQYESLLNQAQNNLLNAALQSRGQDASAYQGLLNAQLQASSQSRPSIGVNYLETPNLRGGGFQSGVRNIWLGPGGSAY